MNKTMLQPDVIRSAVDARIGPVADMHRLSEGEVSQAFEVRIGGDGYVVRVAATPDGYEKERYVAGNLLPSAVPVPRIVDIWAHDGRHAMCVSQLAEGATVDRYGPDAAAELITQVRHIHQAIASAPLANTHGFGPFDTTGCAPHRSWSDFLLSELDEPFEPPDNARDEVDEIRAELARLAPACPDIRLLAHGDFGGKNMLAAGRRVTAVIDWAQALFGDPIYDVARSVFWGTWVEPMRIHGRALWADWASSPAADVRLRSALLHIGLGATRYFHQQGRDDISRSMIGPTRDLCRVRLLS